MSALQEKTKADHVIRRMLQAAGCGTQKELAESLRTIPSTISAWKVRGSVPMEWVYRAAHLFHVAPHWLMTGEQEGGQGDKSLEPGITVLDISGAAVSLRVTLPADQQLIGIVYSESGITKLREYVCRPVIQPWLNDHGEVVPDLGAVPYVMRRSAADSLGDWLAMVCFRATEPLGPILAGDWLLVDTSQVRPISPHIYLVGVAGRLLVRRFVVAAQGGQWVGEDRSLPLIPEEEASVFGRVLERAGPL
ncbi:helix-turn-helix domain-containing protein [Desulfonatronum thioautotrophicum]|uniref:helix-turn-helix domain-containing protein n=1 Tax=Desulfonatronum thioautotrophicum TaxID=617001 RepID=UPI0012948366|nr:helix-turn-helix domain-containing protein [Desulfonatronum thioautotrophicum]